MTLADQYNEHGAAALKSCEPHIIRVGARVVGMVADDDHRYGWHLSARRLIGTGRDDDKSLRGPNLPIVDDRAACAIDISADWPASGEWLEDVRQRCASGDLVDVAEIIGDPDLIPGAPRDIKDACYAAPSTGWRWVEYRGQGHVTWCHIGIWRARANDRTLGDRLLGGWTAAGRKDEDDMDVKEFRQALPAAYVPRPENLPPYLGEYTPTAGYLWHGTYMYVTRIEAALRAFIAGEEVRDAATDRLLREGTGNPETAAILATIRQEAAATRTAVLAQADEHLRDMAAALDAAATNPSGGA